MKPTSVVLLSGGINSLVAGMRVLDETQPHILYVDYGLQASVSERAAVRRIADALALPLHDVRLPRISELVPGKRERDRPDAAETPSPSELLERRIAGTMLTLFGVAQQLAVRLAADRIVCGVSQVCNEMEFGARADRGDPDARYTFIHAARVAIDLGMPAKRKLKLDVPFIHLGRAEIVRLGHRLGAPLHLTWWCHQAGEVPCGDCVGCVSRRDAFEEVGAHDPQVAGLG